MNKAELVALLAEKTGESKATVERGLKAEAEAVAEAVRAGKEVKVGLGKFFSAVTKAKEGINPQDTSKKIKIPAKKVMKFKFSSQYKVIEVL